MKKLLLLLVALTAVVFPTASRAQYEGKSVVLIYNTEDMGSLDVAEYYATKRNVPLDNIIGLKLSTNELISRAEFISTLQQPLLKKLVDHKLFTFEGDKLVSSKVRFAALCYGVPLKISPAKNLKEAGASKLPEALQRNEAAVDSELAWLPRIKTNPLLAGKLASGFFGVTNASAMQATNGLLMVARLDGPTPEIAKSLVDKALLAETNGHWGRAYFDLRGIKEGQYQAGDDSLAEAANFTRLAGMETIEDRQAATFGKEFPMSHIGFYAGWYDEHVSGPFTTEQVEFLPGAIAYHLHSFSASTIRQTNSNWVGPLLGKGVTATLGTVYEPYLSGTPHMGVFTYRLMRHGFSFAEAAYAAQSSVSWMTTVVGDPLYRPYGRPHKDIHEQLMQQKLPLLDWSILRIVNINLAKGTPVKEMIRYLGSLENTKKSSVLLEKMGDLMTADGEKKNGAQIRGMAMAQPSSPQQRIRVILGLAEYFSAAGEKEKATSMYDYFIKSFPKYPKLADVKLALQKLGK
jgi:uncharacterized protein (TIGR03790 family)